MKLGVFYIQSYIIVLNILIRLYLVLRCSTKWNPAIIRSHAFSNDEASLHGWDSERKLLEATRGAHVPVPLPTTTASTATMSRRPAGLDAPQQIGYNFCCVLSLVRRTHDLCYPVWCAAIIWRTKIGQLETIRH